MSLESNPSHHHTCFPSTTVVQLLPILPPFNSQSLKEYEEQPIKNSSNIDFDCDALPTFIASIYEKILPIMLDFGINNQQLENPLSDKSKFEKDIMAPSQCFKLVFGLKSK